MNQIDATDARLATHEEICALRYEAIQKVFESGSKRMSRIEYILYALIAVTLLGPGFAAHLIQKML
jgi:cell division protein FtsL